MDVIAMKHEGFMAVLKTMIRTLACRKALDFIKLYTLSITRPWLEAVAMMAFTALFG